MAVWKIKERYELSRANDNRPNRAIEMAGFEPAHTKNGSSILMASSSNSTDFGDLTNNRTLFGGMTASNQTRALFYGGEVPGSNSNEIDSVQLATEGNASDHGDLTTAVGYAAATSNGTRALVAGGNTVINTIGFGSIVQTGNFADFGDLAESRNAVVGICSPTRAIFAGGTDGTSPSPAYTTRIDFVTINSTGNASDFGDLTGNTGYLSACQNKSRAFFIGGAVPGGGNATKNNSATDVITIATTGNAQEFGNLTQATRNAASVADGRSGFTLGGANPSYNNVIQRFDMSSLGNMTDYSDLNASKGDNKGGCGSHDGIDHDGLHPQLPSVTYMPGSGRGFINPGTATGGAGGSINRIQMIFVPTLGNAVDFGDLSVTRQLVGATNSITRSCVAGGENTSGTKVNTIDYYEMQSLGNAADFGDLTNTRRAMSNGGTNGSRGTFHGGNTPSQTNVIDYITFATAGNATDFGDMTVARDGAGTLSSPTRTVSGGGSGKSDVIDYITTASTGNAQDFGDMTYARNLIAAASSTVRGVWMGGYGTSPVTRADTMDYVTIASTGNATDFGDLPQGRAAGAGISNNIRGLHAGGEVPGTDTTQIEFITIATTGNTSDFGDLVEACQYISGTCDGNSGLQG